MDSQDNHNAKKMPDVVFHHLVEFARVNCLFCSAREKETGKAKLFLMFQDPNRVYVRNALKDTWEEVTNKEQSRTLQDGLQKAVKEKKVPSFRQEGQGFYDLPIHGNRSR